MSGPSGGSADRVRTDDIPAALRELASGRPVVVLDAADRENEGDLVMAAQHATPEWMAFFVRHGSGYLCVPLEAERADHLGLPLMVSRNEESMSTAFTVTVDAREGIGTGISAVDRSRTVALLGDPLACAADLVRPGHVLPLRARAGGVLARPGHTEAAVDLTRLAELHPVGVIVELVEDDGSMRDAVSCRTFCDEHGLLLVTIEDLVAHLRAEGADAAVPVPSRRAGAVRVAPAALERSASTRLPTASGTFTAHGYRQDTGTEHVALVAGDVTPSGGAGPVLVRVHSECLTGDVLGSARCDCGAQLQASLDRISAAGRGVLVYLRGHEGRGIGLVAKLSAYALQDAGLDTVDANLELGLPVDARDYAVAASVLGDLGVGPVRLMTNNPDKVDGLRALGVDVREREGVLVDATADSAGYLLTKQQRMGHDLPQLAHSTAAADSRRGGDTIYPHGAA